MSNTYNQCFDLLLQAGANVNSKGRNLLVELFDYEDVTYTDKLIKAGAKVNVFEDAGDTPLMLVSSGYGMHKDDVMAERAALLLKSGVRINYKNQMGLNALTASIFRSSIFRYGEKRNAEMILLAAYLIKLDPHLHLFGRISKLGLPSLVTEY